MFVDAPLDTLLSVAIERQEIYRQVQSPKFNEVQLEKHLSTRKLNYLSQMETLSINNIPLIKFNRDEDTEDLLRNIRKGIENYDENNDY